MPFPREPSDIQIAPSSFESRSRLGHYQLFNKKPVGSFRLIIHRRSRLKPCNHIVFDCESAEEISSWAVMTDKVALAIFLWTKAELLEVSCMLCQHVNDRYPHSRQ